MVGEVPIYIPNLKSLNFYWFWAIYWKTGLIDLSFELIALSKSIGFWLKLERSYKKLDQSKKFIRLLLFSRSATVYSLSVFTSRLLAYANFLLKFESKEITYRLSYDFLDLHQRFGLWTLAASAWCKMYCGWEDWRHLKMSGFGFNSKKMVNFEERLNNAVWA